MDSKTETFLEYKALLFSMAYNMLGNVDAAEDMVQDTFLKWMEIPAAHVKYTKAYLVKMVTNKCINYLHSARLQREEYIGIWLPEPLLNYDTNSGQGRVESYHALSIGILVLLEKLTPSPMHPGRLPKWYMQKTLKPTLQGSKQLFRVIQNNVSLSLPV